MRAFLAGLICAGASTVALYFLRFRRQTGDPVFSAFAVAFALMAGNHAALAFLDAEAEARVALYGVRLAAYSLIVVAIVRANRSS